MYECTDLQYDIMQITQLNSAKMHPFINAIFSTVVSE